MRYCRKCGQELPDGAKFCLNCGEPVSVGTTKRQNKREQTYAGKIVKCPNCGETLDAFVTVCPACGCRIRGAENSTAVQNFGIRLSQARSEAEKINIIRNFPIPNTVEDVLEFAILASTNINEHQNLDDEVSDAWYAKLQQAYQKACLSFKDQPEFDRVEKIFNQVKKVRSRNRIFKGLSFIFHYKIMRVIAVIILVIIVGEACSAISNESKDDTTISSTLGSYQWPTAGCSQYLPTPPSSTGKIRTNDETSFSITVGEISEKQFQDYVSACKEEGFTIDVTENDSIFYAYNEEQYDLDIFYSSKESKMDIYINAPMEMTEIHWPDSDVVSQIPTPGKMTGHIQTEQADKFSVYIDEMSSDEFNAYVDECMEQGFTVDYYRGEDSFHASNKEGYYLQIEEQTFDIMYINISEPEEED